MNKELLLSILLLCLGALLAFFIYPSDREITRRLKASPFPPFENSHSLESLNLPE